MDINKAVNTIKNSCFIYEKINIWFEEKVKNLDTEISKSFEKNRDLFLTQFENKVKLIIKQKTNDLN